MRETRRNDIVKINGEFRLRPKTRVSHFTGEREREREIEARSRADKEGDSWNREYSGVEIAIEIVGRAIFLLSIHRYPLRSPDAERKNGRPPISAVVQLKEPGEKSRHLPGRTGRSAR